MSGVVGPRFAQISTLWNDLLAYYTADNTPNDALGTYDGTLTNGATYGTGIINQGFSFDGVNDYVDIGNNLDFDGSTPFSFSCWVNSNANTTTIFNKFNSSGSYPGYALVIQSSGLLRFYLQNNNSTNRMRVDGTTTITSGFKHIVLTYDGSTDANGVKMYINGVSDTLSILSNSFTGGLTTSIPFTIGNGIIGFNNYNGITDEIGIWDRELTASEVTELYNSGVGKQYPN